MRCLHPHCPMSPASSTWQEVVDHSELRLQPKHKAAAAAWLALHFATGPVMPPASRPPPPIPIAALARLLRLCPCLFNQIDIAPTARAIVHFCELTLGQKITAANVHAAFFVQHPKLPPDFSPGPLRACPNGGTIMEMLCSEVLTSAGILPMPVGAGSWPDWKMPGHVLLNEGKMASLQALGDILIPCAPTNLIISVKSEVARERLLYSANSIEGVGFGFFKQADEFWTSSRMSLYKRMGFTAIYMPDETHHAVMSHVVAQGEERHAVNINGTELYRPLSIFADDMLRVVGKSSALL
jgi:hypothetical protein